MSACIIDARLALAPHGLQFALRLAQVRRAWLVRSMWALLDNDVFFRERPELFDDTGEGVRRVEMLRQWRLAWMRANLLDRFWWVGDARHESLLPPDVGGDAVDRFNLLADAYDARLDNRKSELAPLNDCARDAVVLAAALALHSPIILTLPDGRDGRPHLCRLLRDADIVCREMNGAEHVAAFRDGILAGPLRLAAEQLFLAGLEVAAVHVVAPRAVVLTAPDEGDLDFDGGDERDPWSGAVAIWHRLN